MTNPAKQVSYENVGSSSTVALFCEAAELGGDGIVPPEVAELLRAAYRNGQEAHPDVALQEEHFATCLGGHTRGGDPVKYLQTVHAADLYLACAAARGDKRALSIFDARFIGRVREYLVRTTVDKDVVDEVQQRLRQNLLVPAPSEGDGQALPAGGKLLDYAGKGPLGGWIRVAAVRTALNYLRGTGVTKEADEARTGLPLDPELSYIHARSDELFRTVFRRVLEELDVDSRTVLRLHYMQGLTMDQLAVMFQTSRSSIARRVAEARKSILEHTERVLRVEHKMAPSSIASLIRRADSQLNLSMTKLGS